MLSVRLSFRAKLLVALVGTVGLLLTVILVIVRGQTQRQIDRVVELATTRSRDAFAEQERVLDDQLVRLGLRLAEGVRVLAALQAALESGDPLVLAAAAADELKLAGFERGLLSFTDAEGRPLLSFVAAQPVELPAVAEDPLVERVLREGAANVFGYRLVSDTLYAVHVLPLEFFGQLLGTLTLGFPVGDDLARDFGSVIDAEVCFVARGRCVASTAAADSALRSAMVAHAGGTTPRLSARSQGRWILVSDRLSTGSSTEGWRVIAVRVDEVLMPLERIGRAASFAGAAALALAIVLGVILSRGLTNPVRELVAATQRLGRGEFDTRVDVKSGDEIGILARAFNEMITQRRALEEELRQAQKMEAVGRLAGGIAHDFGNVLTVIKSATELLLQEMRAEDPRREDLEQVRQAADRATGLVRQLLAFSRRQVFEPQVMDLTSVLSTELKMLRRLLSADVEVVMDLESDLGAVRGDPGHIGQVLMNLVVNARDAMPAGGRLSITTRNVELDEDSARRRVAAKPGPYVVLDVSDTGVGMSKEVQERIFEPFFTTKDVGKGTGLGLATVYGLVRQAGGHIEVHSEPGRGSTFRIYFPCCEEQPARPGVPRSQPAVRPATGTETIFVIEDDSGIRAVVRKILSRQGYTVIEAATAAEAVSIARGHSGTIHLLLTDIGLPDGSGTELAELITSKRPETQVLCMSGYAEGEARRFEESQLRWAFLEKPFSPEILIRRVREVLDAPLAP
ncbi:MAG: HAMP domain-containing protein [Gemmatimonadetes bacterium]|nr:HAMP domain-containing protein [Gemmatimonadota bacterium]